MSDPDGVEWEVYNLNHDVDEEASAGGAASIGGGSAAKAAPGVNSKGRTKLQGAELRNAQKELGSVSRRLEKVTTQISALHDRFASHDQSDYSGLAALQGELATLEGSMAELELRWLELSELLEP